MFLAHSGSAQKGRKKTTTGGEEKERIVECLAEKWGRKRKRGKGETDISYLAAEGEESKPMKSKT